MSRLATVAVLVVMAAPALAQSPPPLAYAQPLAPPAVRAVQDKLHQLGAYAGAVDGTWGPDSQAALQQFQQGHGLQVTGQINPATAAALGLNPASLLQLSPVEQSPPLARPTPADIRALQARLRTLGFYTGGIDGQWGPATQDALKRLQQNRGFQPTGELDAQTIRAMGLNPNDLTAPAR